MDNNAEGFDLLSAALNESGLTGDFTGFGDSELTPSTGTTAASSDTRAGGDINQAEVFTQALKQLAANNAPTSKQVLPSIGHTPQSFVGQRIVSANSTGHTTSSLQYGTKPSIQPSRNIIVTKSGNTFRTMLAPQSYSQRLQSLTSGGSFRSSSPVSGGVRVVRIGGSGALNFTSNSSPVVPVTTNGSIRQQLTNRDVSRLWFNEDIKYKNISRQSSPAIINKEEDETNEEEIEEEDEELGHAETYADYMPSKLRIGYKHPDPVVETSSLSSVEPPDIRYKLSLPEKTIDYADLSALQLEAIVYACQRHEEFLPSGERAGFLIGDGAGVGKGRTIAGIIFENYILGRKRALWLSVSNDLRVDAERDLHDVGAGKIDVHALNKFKYGKISSKDNNSVKKGVIFATYSSLIGESQSGGKYRTRMKQLLHWCGKDFDGLIIFDECHKAKNLCPTGSSKPTKTGLSVLDLQNKLPKARIVYASATGATEPRNMAYMTRLGLWGVGTPFKEFNDFIQAVERRGVGAMELVAMDMKLRGMYIARQLSFHGVTFRIEEIPVSKETIKVYNASVKLWVDAREKFQLAADLIDAEKQMRKSMWGQFWSAHQRFFKYLCISAKVPFLVKLAREAVKDDKCVVIGLQSTGEARTLEQLEEQGELTDFVSTAKGVFQSLVEKHFPAPNTGKVFDMFGFGKSIFDELRDTPPSSPKTTRSGQKRKRGDRKAKKGKKKYKEANGKASESDSEFCPSSDESSDSSLSDESLSENEDDFNPFGSGSDSDTDSWIQKPRKPKKAKKSKPKKDKDSFDDKFDRALEAAGLKASNKPVTRENSSSSLGSLQGARINPLAGTPDGREKAQALKQELLDSLEVLGDKLPPNTLDELIDSLGGTENVAEMTGRKGRVVTTEDGNVQYESRSEFDVPLETLNLTEKQRFMDGEKNIAIISEAASSGISLQADRRAVNQRRRVHLTLELPWSADRAIQQFGRTHRSNQVNAPEYVFLISELAGERRFASTVAKRLESLGALTHGDRRATESRDLSRFNFDNKYGRVALEGVMKSVVDLETSIVPPPKKYSGDFVQDARKAFVGVGLITMDLRMNIPLLEKDYNSMSKFLNRILGVEVELQNCIFQFFTDTLEAVILQAKRNGKWDMGILDLGSGSENVKVLDCRQFVAKFSGGSARTELQTISVERGMSWQEALDLWRENSGPEDGFYVSSQSKLSKSTAVLAIALSGSKARREKLYHIYRPNTGRQLRAETLVNIKKKYKKMVADQAQPLWTNQYEASSYTCSHAFWKGNCKRITLGLSCEIGLRTRTYHVLSGSVLSVWSKVESVLTSMPGGHNSKMQIVRLRTEDGRRIVGSLIPSNCVEPLCNVLRLDESFTEVKEPPRPPRPPSHVVHKPLQRAPYQPPTPLSMTEKTEDVKLDVKPVKSPSPHQHHIFDVSSDDEDHKETPPPEATDSSTTEAKPEESNFLSMPLLV